jgi:hypothetical protein
LDERRGWLCIGKASSSIEEIDDCGENDVEEEV